MAAPDEAPSGSIAAAERPAMKKKSSWSKVEDAKLREQVRLHGAENWKAISAGLTGRSARSCRFRWCQQLLLDQQQQAPPPRRRQDGTLPLFPLVPGDVRTMGCGGGPVLRRQPPDEAVGNDQSGACLALFPLEPGDLTNGSNNACEAAAMDVDVGDGDLLEMRLWPASTSMVAFKAMVQSVRAP